MRKIGTLLLTVLVIASSGCGCFESYADRNLVTGGGGRDPNQPEWHRCLFGTTWLPAPPPQYYFPNTEAERPPTGMIK